MSDASKMQYTVGPVVFVRLRHQDNRMGRHMHDESNLVRKFFEFCEREDLINVGGGITGPSTHVGYYTSSREDDARTVDDLYELVQSWLDEQGVTAEQEW